MDSLTFSKPLVIYENCSVSIIELMAQEKVCYSFSKEQGIQRILKIAPIFRFAQVTESEPWSSQQLNSNKVSNVLLFTRSDKFQLGFAKYVARIELIPIIDKVRKNKFLKYPVLQEKKISHEY